MDYNRSSTDLSATVISASGQIAGNIIPFQTASQNNAVGGIAGVLLGVGTYVFSIGSPSGDAQTPAQTTIVGVQFQWVASLAGVLTLEICNFPGMLGKLGAGAADISDFDASVAWTPCNPSSAQVDVTGSGNTVSNATVTAGGTAAGSAFYHLGNWGPRRTRFKWITTAGGLVRGNACGKLGS